MKKKFILTFLFFGYAGLVSSCAPAAPEKTKGEQTKQEATKQEASEQAQALQDPSGPKDYRDEFMRPFSSSLPPTGLDDVDFADQRVLDAYYLLHSREVAKLAKGVEAIDALIQSDDIQVATDARMALAVMTKDHTKTRALLENCVEANPIAVHCLTWLGFYRGSTIGGEVDLAGSVEAYGRAAALGSPDAQYSYGMAFYRGDGVKADAKTAYEWIEKAARQDHQGGLNRYAEMKAKGLGTSVDKRQAYKASARAAALGNGFSLYNIGLYLEAGEGVEQNSDLAATAFVILARSHNSKAIRKVEQLLRDTPPEDADAWREKALARSDRLMEMLEKVQVFE